MKERVDAMTALMEATLKTVKTLTFRNILVIALLLGLIFPLYVGIWFLRTENRSFLLDIYGNTRIIKLVSNCPVVRTNFQGSELYNIILSYNTDDTGTYYFVSTMEKLDNKIANKICGVLNSDRDVLRDFYFKKADVPALPKLP